jgi:uncharacterized cysteine cluster protein YcgN (CxxCxxCC family)
MRDVLTRLRAWDSSRALSGTTFCDGCGQVCTPACRREALRERNQMRVRAATLYRLSSQTRRGDRRVGDERPPVEAAR